MTSNDSGVETGNDSNDSAQADINNIRFEVQRAMKAHERQRLDTDVKTDVSKGEVPKTIPQIEGDRSWLTKNRSEVASKGLPPPLHTPFAMNLRVSSNHPKLISKTMLRFKEVELPFTGRPIRSTFRMIARGTPPSLAPSNARKLRRAAATNNIELLATVLSSGISPNMADEAGRTALHLAAARGYEEAVKILLQYGADPNKTDTLGNTPLHLAAISSKVAVVVALLRAGTKVMSFDRHGFNPLQLAQTKLRMLRSYHGVDLEGIKGQIQSIVNMLLAYLHHQRNSDEKIEELSSFCSKLSLSNTNDQVKSDVDDLLASIDGLTLSSE